MEPAWFTAALPINKLSTAFALSTLAWMARDVEKSNGCL